MCTVPQRQTAVFTIRDAREADHEHILNIGNTLFPDDYQETAEEFRHHRERLRAGALSLTHGCLL